MCGSGNTYKSKWFIHVSWVGGIIMKEKLIMKKIFTLILTISFLFLFFGISHAGIVVLKTSTDNTRTVFNQLSAKQLLGLTIYAESRKNSSIEGRNAVGSVILERNDYYRWGVKKIILQPLWFSPFNPTDKGFYQLKLTALNFRYYLKKNSSLQESYLVAEMLLNGSMPRHKVIAEYGVQHFTTIKCENRWTRKMVVVAVLDGHKFLCQKREVVRIGYCPLNYKIEIVKGFYPVKEVAIVRSYILLV
jgi:hypothetical protein